MTSRNIETPEVYQENERPPEHLPVGREAIHSRAEKVLNRLDSTRREVNPIIGTMKIAGELFVRNVHVPENEKDKLLHGLGRESFFDALQELEDIALNPSDPSDEEDDRRACESDVRALIDNTQVLVDLSDEDLVKTEKTLLDILSRPLPDDLPGALGKVSRRFSVKFGRRSDEMLPQSNGTADLAKNLLLFPLRALNHLPRNAVSLFRTDARRRLEELRSVAAFEIQARARRK